MTASVSITQEAITIAVSSVHLSKIKSFQNDETQAGVTYPTLIPLLKTPACKLAPIEHKNAYAPKGDRRSSNVPRLCGEIPQGASVHYDVINTPLAQSGQSGSRNPESVVGSNPTRRIPISNGTPKGRLSDLGAGQYFLIPFSNPSPTPTIIIGGK